MIIYLYMFIQMYIYLLDGWGQIFLGGIKGSIKGWIYSVISLSKLQGCNQAIYQCVYRHI
jgi:hypothetical protein